MAEWNRRQWLTAFATAGLGAAGVAAERSGPKPERQTATSAEYPGAHRRPLPLVDYQPRSMLHVTETHLPRSRYPNIDFHSHLSWIDRKRQTDAVHHAANPEEILQVMDSKNVRMMVNLTGGYGPLLEETIRYWQVPHPDRFMVFVEPWYDKIVIPNYAHFQADQIERSNKMGAKGLKILKTLGLYLREQVKTGPLVKIDDRRFDEMWETAGALNMPVAIHISENLSYVSACLDRYPNMYVDIAARIGELGRQPRTARKFFDKYQDRILFATDATPHGDETPQQIFGRELYEIYYRFLETEDEYFDYAPAPKPPQGRWRIYGIGLPKNILRKVYYENAARLLGLSH